MSKNKDIDSTKEFGKLMGSMNRTLRMANLFIKFYLWYKNTGELISKIIGALLGSAWASTLIIYICTENVFWLKVFFGTIGLILALAFQIVWINAIIAHKNKNRKPIIIDMKDMVEPKKDDINLKKFSGYKHVKYRVLDKNDPQYGMQFFLYPMYGRLNDNHSLTYFKTTQITEVSEKQN